MLSYNLRYSFTNVLKNNEECIELQLSEKKNLLMAKYKLLLVLLMATTASLVAGRSLYLWERTSEIVSDKETFQLLLLLLLLLFELVTVLYDLRRFSRGTLTCSSLFPMRLNASNLLSVYLFRRTQLAVNVVG